MDALLLVNLWGAAQHVKYCYCTLAYHKRLFPSFANSNENAQLKASAFYHHYFALQRSSSIYNCFLTGRGLQLGQCVTSGIGAKWLFIQQQ